MITVRDIVLFLEDLLPKAWKMDFDNVALQVGNYQNKVNRVLISLNISKAVVEEAIEKKCNLILAHHPLIFKPLRNVIAGNDVADIITKLVKHDIAFVAHHTNYDVAPKGVSVLLAEKLGLLGIKPLVSLKKLLGKDFVENFKIVCYLPKGYVEKMRDALAKIGVGALDNYDYCFFESEGKGMFRPGRESLPYIGVQGEISKIEEVRVESIFPSWKLNKVLKVLHENHPYEKPAYDIFRLENDFNNYGLGVIGYLPDSLNELEFLSYLSSLLEVDSFKMGAKSGVKEIKKVAVLGGSGSKFISFALKQGADAFLTSECGHHDFLDVAGKMLLVDANHQVTEKFAVEGFTSYLKKRYVDLELVASEADVDPVKYYYNKN